MNEDGVMSKITIFLVPAHAAEAIRKKLNDPKSRQPTDR